MILHLTRLSPQCRSHYRFHYQYHYIDFDYQNDNLIIDQVKIQYYGKEECLFFNENGKQSIHKIKGETNKNQYITTIY